MKVVVPGTGFGKRLLPYTRDLPKLMLPLGDKPILEHLILKFKGFGLNEVIVTILQKYSEPIRKYFGKGTNFGVKLTYIPSDTPLGTAGSVLAARDHLHKTFLVFYGDIISNVDLSKAISFHRLKKGIATIVLVKKVRHNVGIVSLDITGRLTNFEEKPYIKEFVNAGIYILEPSSFKYMDQGSDFGHDVFPSMIGSGEEIYGFPTDAYWYNITSPYDYEQLNRLFLKGAFEKEDE